MKNTSVLNPENLDWVGERFLDPIGRVFRLDGEYFRAVYPDQVQGVDRLFRDCVIRDLVAENLLIPTWRSDLKVDGYGATLAMQKVHWNVPPDTWPRRVLRDAALTWITINERLLPHGLGLIDSHLGNLVLSGRCIPRWVDLGSIATVTNPLMGIQEFFRCMLHPLQMLARGASLERTARLLIRDGGVTPEEHRQLLGLVRFRAPLIAILGGSGHLCRSARSLAKRSIGIGRKRLLTSLRRAIERVNPSPSEKFWTDYRAGIPLVGMPGYQLPPESNRIATIAELISRVKPATVLDVGANDGFFSALAAQQGAAVLAADTDDGALDKFVCWARTVPMDLQAAASVAAFPNLSQKAELVLGLALVHHVAITQQFKFHSIARSFAELSTKALITEFMPNGLGGCVMQPNPLPEFYKLDIFLAELRRYFEEVAVIQYEQTSDASPRTLIFCDRKK